MSLISTMKRDSITILADILKTLELSPSATKTRIVYRANLNFERIRKYLRLLLATGHIEIIKSKHGSTHYKITDKGREFLMGYERLMGALKTCDLNRSDETQSAIIARRQTSTFARKFMGVKG